MDGGKGIVTTEITPSRTERGKLLTQSLFSSRENFTILFVNLKKVEIKNQLFFYLNTFHELMDL